VRTIDAHLHVWDFAVSDYAWLGPGHGALHASWSPQQAHAELDAAGIGGAILVQAEDSRADTRYLLDVATENDWVLGVVGWVQLDDTAAAIRDLDEWTAHPAFRAVRHLLADDPREFLELPAVRASLAELARRGLPFEVHDAWPRSLAPAGALDIPDLTLVIDHLGKPPRDTEARAGWRAALARVAEHPLAVAKVSGLQSFGEPFTDGDAREPFEVALELFGADRLLWGGDWPITVPSGGYPAAWTVYSRLIGELSGAEQEKILRTTAERVYRLT